MPQLRAIKTSRLLIRPPLVEDSKMLKEAIEESFTMLHHWMPWARMIPSLDTTRRYLEDCVRIWRAPIAEHDECPMQIMDKRDRNFLGATGFKPHNTELPSFEVGYWVREKYKGQGYITEAVNALVQYLFKHYKARRIEIQCEIANLKSAQVAERLGFELEAVLKNHRMKPDGSGPTDTLLYVRTTPEGLPELDIKWY